MLVLAELDGFQRWLLMGALPMLLIYLVGLVLAIVWVRRHPGPAWCVIGATTLIVLFDLLLPIFVEWRVRSFMMGDDALWLDTGYEPAWVEWWWKLRPLISGLTWAGAWTLMLLAAFKWRGAAAMTAAAPLHAAAENTLPAATGGAGPIPKGFYLGGIAGAFGLSLVLSLPALVMVFSRDRDVATAGIALACGAFLPMLFGAVVLLMLIHKLWAGIQDGHARTTPGKAVGFLFIPFFNFYWVFQVYWGWAVDFNRLRDRHGLQQVPRAAEGLGLALSIIAVLAVIPYLGFVLGVVNLILVVVFFHGAIDGVNALVAARDRSSATP